MTREELLDSLLVERYSGDWWTSATKRADRDAINDSDVTTAKRRRDMVADFERASTREAS